jgi:predicted MFS family arabinose efflux permease
VLATTLLTLVLTDHLNATCVLIIAGFMGLVRPSDLGVRGALNADIMPRDQLISSIAISRTTQDLARIAGALSGAGLFAGSGLGPSYVVIVGLYAIATVLMLCVVMPAKPRRADDAASAIPRRSPVHDLKEGVSHVWTSPAMQAGMWIAFLTNLTAYPFTNGLLPYIAREIYGGNQAVLGYLSAAFAVGSLTGSVILSLVASRGVGKLMLYTAAAWYLMLLIFSQMQIIPVAMACLTLAGIVQSMSMIAIAVILMQTAGERFRGRVMGVRMLTIYGLPIGLMAAGSLIDVIGFSATVTLYVGVGLAALMAIALHWRASAQRAQAQAQEQAQAPVGAG